MRKTYSTQSSSLNNTTEILMTDNVPLARAKDAAAKIEAKRLALEAALAEEQRKL